MAEKKNNEQILKKYLDGEAMLAPVKEKPEDLLTLQKVTRKLLDRLEEIEEFNVPAPSLWKAKDSLKEYYKIAIIRGLKSDCLDFLEYRTALDGLEELCDNDVHCRGILKNIFRDNYLVNPYNNFFDAVFDKILVSWTNNHSDSRGCLGLFNHIFINSKNTQESLDLKKRIINIIHQETKSGIWGPLELCELSQGLGLHSDLKLRLIQKSRSMLEKKIFMDPGLEAKYYYWLYSESTNNLAQSCLEKIRTLENWAHELRSYILRNLKIEIPLLHELVEVGSGDLQVALTVDVEDERLNNEKDFFDLETKLRTCVDVYKKNTTASAVVEIYFKTSDRSMRIY